MLQPSQKTLTEKIEEQISLSTKAIDDYKKGDELTSIFSGINDASTLIVDNLDNLSKDDCSKYSEQIAALWERVSKVVFEVNKEPGLNLFC